VYWVRDPFWGALSYAAYYALRLLPVRTVSNIGRLLALVDGRFRSRDVTRQSEHSLSLICPDLTAAARKEIVRETWANEGRLEAEMTVIDRLLDAVELTVVNAEGLQAHLRTRRPIVFVFPHLGNWEVLAMVGQRHGLVLNVVYEELRSRFDRSLVARIRRNLGYRLISPDRVGVRNLFHALARGESLGIAIDEYRDGNVVSPAFGRALPERSNIHFALKIARRFGAAIVPAVCVRTAPHAFTLTLQEALEDPSAAELNALCESWIRAHPEQWYMLHRLRMDIAP
jgi:KDO2-lipid IV(A) lauroyltransferase